MLICLGMGYSSHQVMPFTLLLPMIGFMCGALMLDEPIAIRMLIGAAATILGVGIIIRRRPDVAAPSTRTSI
jgi:O-acetylserine/cysteine efflux transporter